MVINKGGNLSKDYFKAYLKLIMNSLEVSIELAREKAFARLFSNKENTLGSISYSNFIRAYCELEKEIAH
ncbi:hypothetical protein ABW02_26015 [Niallia circulans]|jgi:hypothetical protein|uniref:Uncharacterized protein n=2 Tax=Niallia TaxID=2837506 RepID=A0A0J1HL86_NIACI|nr:MULTISPECIES: hypothetical protein [Bacillaceae]EOR21647.1 hypothetical protein A499_22162 [Niallia nealsonii AAU1]SLL35208.1 Uncharacterised protein [Mycobacteroides abscessus subsp. abscessus]HEO8421380.1 hypothetical protein [Yersinia enterocolitica]KAB7670339.1 hypothetical protein F9279_08750 [Bacillus sp. B1-b2]KLV14501.1 hypothetical protein ABW02_26015 [Niallia circulans]